MDGNKFLLRLLFFVHKFLIKTSLVPFNILLSIEKLSKGSSLLNEKPHLLWSDGQLVGISLNEASSVTTKSKNSRFKF